MKTLDSYIEGLKETDNDAYQHCKEMEELAKLVSQVIKQRNKLGISQRELAEMCGLPQSSIARFETMKNSPNLNTLINICSHLGLKISIINH